MKHGIGKEEAREMYVYQQMTFGEIAARIGRSEKTVRAWADAGGWREAKSEVLGARATTREKLQILIDKIADRMIRDSDSDADLSPQSIHALTNLVMATKNLYAYESKAQADVAQTAAHSEQLSPEEIAAKVREIMGA